VKLLKQNQEMTNQSVNILNMKTMV